MLLFDSVHPDPAAIANVFLAVKPRVPHAGSDAS